MRQLDGISHTHECKGTVTQPNLPPPSSQRPPVPCRPLVRGRRRHQRGFVPLPPHQLEADGQAGDRSARHRNRGVPAHTERVQIGTHLQRTRRGLIDGRVGLRHARGDHRGGRQEKHVDGAQNIVVRGGQQAARVLRVRVVRPAGCCARGTPRVLLCAAARLPAPAGGEIKERARDISNMKHHTQCSQ